MEKITVYIATSEWNCGEADFELLDDAIAYKEENEPKNELWNIEVVNSAE